MNFLLKEKLSEYEKNTQITNDKELYAALKKIVEETVPENDNEIEMLNEAVDMMLFLDGVDETRINNRADKVTEEYLCLIKEHKAINKNSTAKHIRIKWVIPIAAVMSIVLLTIVFTSANGIDFIGITRDAFVELKENVMYYLGREDYLIKSPEAGLYDSAEEMMEAENITSILWPEILPEGYKLNMIRVVVYDTYKTVIADAYDNKNNCINIFIDTPGKGNLENYELTEIGDYKVVEGSYNGVYQAEFNHNGNYYIINAPLYENLIEVINNLKEKDNEDR